MLGVRGCTAEALERLGAGGQWCAVGWWLVDGGNGMKLMGWFSANDGLVYRRSALKLMSWCNADDGRICCG